MLSLKTLQKLVFVFNIMYEKCRVIIITIINNPPTPYFEKERNMNCHKFTKFLILC